MLKGRDNTRKYLSRNRKLARDCRKGRDRATMPLSLSLTLTLQLPMVVPSSISPRNLAILLVSQNVTLPIKTKQTAVLTLDTRHSIPKNLVYGASLMGYRMLLTESKNTRGICVIARKKSAGCLRTASLVRSYACIQKTGTYLHPRRTKLTHTGRGSRPSSQLTTLAERKRNRQGWGMSWHFFRAQPKHAQHVK